MKKLWLALALLLASAPAWADQTAAERALSQELMTQLNGKLNCGADLILAQQKVQELEAKLKALEAKEKKQ